MELKDKYVYNMDCGSKEEGEMAYLGKYKVWGSKADSKYIFNCTSDERTRMTNYVSRVYIKARVEVKLW